MFRAVTNIVVVNACADKVSITFGSQSSGNMVKKNKIDKVVSKFSATLQKNVGGYEYAISIQHPFARSKIFIGSKNRDSKPYKIEFNGSRTSGNDKIVIRNVLRRLFGKDVFNELYLFGNLTVIEVFVDFSSMRIGRLAPVTQSGKWSIYGQGSDIETLYRGDKLYKWYSKSDWFYDGMLKDQAELPENFINPSEPLARFEKTLYPARGKHKGSRSPAAFVASNASPFSRVRFYDTDLLMGHPCINKRDIFYLMCKGHKALYESCDIDMTAAQLNNLKMLVDACRRRGLGADVDAMVDRGIRQLEFLSPDFNRKLYKRKTGAVVLQYHHMGYVTLELLQLLGFCRPALQPLEIDDGLNQTAPPSKGLRNAIKAIFGTAQVDKIKGKAISYEDAVSLLMLVQASE